MRAAICFACNEAYMPLCKGLVLSLHDAFEAFVSTLEASFHFIDIGCSTPSLDWLGEQGVAIHSFSRSSFGLDHLGDALPRYADAQLCRPFLPRIVGAYDVYIWIDSDIWIQGADAIPEMVFAAAAFPEKTVLCPEYHYGYMAHRNLRNALNAHFQWYAALYKDEDFARDLSYLPMLNSGLFAMTAQCPVWGWWAEEIAAVYAGDYSNDSSPLHFAEQLALNKVLYEKNAVMPLDPLFNYACGGSVVLRNPRGQVVVGYPPFTPIKGVHLLSFSRYGAQFLEKGLLYRKGEYLTDEERHALQQLIRY